MDYAPFGLSLLLCVEGFRFGFRSEDGPCLSLLGNTVFSLEPLRVDFVFFSSHFSSVREVDWSILLIVFSSSFGTFVYALIVS